MFSFDLSNRISLIFPVTLFLIVITTISTVTLAHNNPYRHIANLDNDGRYILEWTVNWENRSVTFNVTVATLGYIGFGLSSRGKKLGADLVIGGVESSGNPYLIDMHGLSNNGNEPVEDNSQDYVLHNAWENSTHTSIQFSRPFETCDQSGQDYTISDDTVVVLWCFGENDDHAHYHYRNRGTFRAHLLDPDWTPREFQEASRAGRVANPEERGDLQVWTISRRQQVPSDRDTSYWCSFHKGPQLERKHHLVGFNFRWENQIEADRTHHMLLFRCQAPDGEDPAQFFEPYVQNNTGEMCFFFLRGESGGLPLQQCRELVYSYAIGGKMFFLPEHAGIPFGDNPNEYYALQVHYDNINRQPLDYTINIDMYYTENLRENEAGIASTGHNIPGSPSILVPPASLSHSIYGHCGSECSHEMLPEEGVNIMAILQHTHLSGRQHRLQQFRNGRELPWILNDDNYDGRFQPTRMQRREIRWMPGDHLVTRCVFDNTWADGSVVGGFTTRQEMCLQYIWYYNKMPDHSICRSEILSEDQYAEKYLGVRNYTWDDTSLEYVVTDPENLRGRTISQVSDSVEWNIQKREELQRDHQFLPQRNLCPSFIQLREGNGEGDGGIVEYPRRRREYRPPPVADSCAAERGRSNNKKWGKGR